MRKTLILISILVVLLSGCTKNIIIDEGPYVIDNTGLFPSGRYEINTHPYFGEGYIFDLADDPEFEDLDVYVVHSEMELALMMAIHIDTLQKDFYYVEERPLDYEKIWPYLASLLVNEVEIQEGEISLPELNPTSTIYTYTFTYDFERIHRVENAIDEWTYETKTSSLTAHLKAELSLLDLLDAVIYDDIALEDKDRIDDGFTALGVFQDGQAVCNGYSQAYMGLLKDLDIPSIMVSSDKDDHAWNMVYVDQQWSYVDATWEDDNPYKDEYWLYFLIDQNTLESDHRFDSGRGETLNSKDYTDFAQYVFPQTNDAH